MKLPMTHKKIFTFLFALALVIFTLFSPVVSKVIVTPAKAQTSNELKEIERKLKELQAQRDAIAKQIKKEQANQVTLAQQAKNLENAMRQNELQVQALELELSKLRIEVEQLTKEQADLENRLKEIQGELDKRYQELSVSINLLYKRSFKNSSFLSENSTFEESIINAEREKSTMKIIKAAIAEVRGLEKEVLDKKAEIDKKQKDAADLQAQKEAQTNNLDLQRQALGWQRTNKDKLIGQSKENQQNLTAQQREANRKIAEMQSAIAAIMNSLLQVPKGGTFVAGGQVIGFEGRSGLACTIYDPALVPTKTNTFCNNPAPRGAGLPSDWYYYDPVAFPTKGAHVHFMYYVNGKISCSAAQAALFNDNDNSFKAMPMTSFYQSQGCHDGGAIDLVSRNGFGAPIYAVKPGLVTYRCVRYPNDPAFPDPLFGAIVNHTDANGNLDGTRSAYWHMRRGVPCDGIWAN